jgi:hypothetical protein
VNLGRPGPKSARRSRLKWPLHCRFSREAGRLALLLSANLLLFQARTKTDRHPTGASHEGTTPKQSPASPQLELARRIPSSPLAASSKSAAAVLLPSRRPLSPLMIGPGELGRPGRCRSRS